VTQLGVPFRVVDGDISLFRLEVAKRIVPSASINIARLRICQSQHSEAQRRGLLDPIGQANRNATGKRSAIYSA
jgi:hypothetical protein